MRYVHRPKRFDRNEIQFDPFMVTGVLYAQAYYSFGNSHDMIMAYSLITLLNPSSLQSELFGFRTTEPPNPAPPEGHHAVPEQHS